MSDSCSAHPGHSARDDRDAESVAMEQLQTKALVPVEWEVSGSVEVKAAAPTPTLYPTLETLKMKTV